MPDDYAANTSTTGRVIVGGSSASRIDFVGDVDWFAIDLMEGLKYEFRLDSNDIRPNINLFDPGGWWVGGDSTTNNTDYASFEYYPNQTGTWYLGASDVGATFPSQGARIGSYVISVVALDDYANVTSSPAVGGVAVGSSSTGRINFVGDHDYFAVSLTAGQTYQFRLDSASIGGIDDPWLQFFAADGSISLFNDNVSSSNLNSLITYTAPTTRTYYLDVANSTGNIGNYVVSATLVGDDYANNTSTTGRVTVGSSSTGNLETTGDHDWFAVSLTAGRTYTINLTGSQHSGGTLQDTHLYLHNSAGAVVDHNDDIALNTNLDSQLSYTPTTTGTYYIDAASYNDSYTGTYTVRVSENSSNFLDDSITQLYVGYYNRAPDPGGETYWVGRLQAGMSLSQIAQSFSVQTESMTLYPFLASPNTASTAAVQAFVDSIYVNLFNRQPDPGGEAYWVNNLQTGSSTVAGAIINIISGAQGNDLLTVNNKVTVGNYYDNAVFNNHVQATLASATSALSGVTYLASSVTAAEANVDAYVLTALPAAATASQTEVNLVGTSLSNELALAA